MLYLKNIENVHNIVLQTWQVDLHEMPFGFLQVVLISASNSHRHNNVTFHLVSYVPAAV